MGLPGKTIKIVGECATGEPVIEGHVTGPIVCEDGTVELAATAVIEGDIIARDITVWGRAAGQLIATDVGDGRTGEVVEGAGIAPRLIRSEKATLNGRVDPKRLDAALGVARFQQKQRASTAS